MGIKPAFSKADLDARMRKFSNAIEMAIIKRMQYLGESCVKHAREYAQSDGFIDRTGKLRSSIGYILFKNGIPFYESFPGANVEGVSEGKRLALEVGGKQKTGISIVVVAGMNYASYVEDYHGKNVLKKTELKARAELPEMLRKLKINISKSL